MSRLALICGGRDYNNKEKVKETLIDIAPTFVIEGGAKGADKLAGEVCDELCIPYCVVPALWNIGTSAGFKRNSLMLKMLTTLAGQNEHMVVAFPGGKGTRMMVNIARRAGVEVVEIS